MSKPVVAVQSGSLRGRSDAGVSSFLGIPFAEPPVGDLRFRHPVPPAPWSDVREADAFGPIAVQPSFGLGSYLPGDPTEQSEDCLTLNVWAPEERSGLVPVMVFFHGGSFVTGSGAGVMYRGTSLCRRGVVVVTVNYRLGALGYLAHRGLAGPGYGDFANFGVADQLAALQWVQTNIASFGGDPGRVTCFGESAGAMSIADVMAMPCSSGLFQRAILQSGADLADELVSGERLAELFARELGLSEVSRDRLSSVPLADLVEAQSAASAALGDPLLSFKPVIDGRLLASAPSGAIAQGKSKTIDVLIGTNRDEFKFFTYSAKEVADLDETSLAALVDGYTRDGPFGRVPVTSDDVLSFYRNELQARGAQASAREMLDSIGTDILFKMPALRLADAHSAAGGRTYLYRFDWPSPFAAGALGACHGLELAFVFGTIDNPVIAAFAGGDKQAQALSAQMQASWVAFATTGDPAVESLSEWPAYDESDRATALFGASSHVERDPLPLPRQFWQARLPRYGVAR